VQLIELINTNIENFALILRALLDRIPILVLGKSDDDINEIIEELTSIVKNRQEIVFYTDFIASTELDDILQLESIDFDSKRTIIKSPPVVTFKAVDTFEDFKAWILGYNYLIDDEEKKAHLLKSLINKTDFFLTLEIENEQKLSVKMEGKNAKILDIYFERHMIQDVMKNTEISVEKMTRIIRKKVNNESIDAYVLKNLLNFEIEENRIKRNILEKNVLDFVNAARRAFAILTRINQLKALGVLFDISEKTLLKTIMYEECKMKRISDFIEREWNENLTMELNVNKSSEFADIIEGLWG